MATTRRRFFTASAASTTLIAMPHVRGAHAAGKLTIGLWDHWVPTANAASTALIEEWAAKEKVEVQIDYITTQGNKLLLTSRPRPNREPATMSLRSAAGVRPITPSSSSPSTTSWSR